MVTPLLTLALALVIIAPGEKIADAIARVASGDTLVVQGVHEERLRITKTITLRGEPGARIMGGGQGTVVTIAAPGTCLADIEVSGSGESLYKEDAGVQVENATDVTIERVTVTDTLFGIQAKGSRRTHISSCVVKGRPIHIAQRGDGIRLYASADSRVEHCTVEDTRDVILWFSEGSTFSNNTIRRARYGLHLMNTHEGVCEQNAIEDASVGIFSMYSTAVILRHNRIGPVRGPSGYGIGLKDTDAFRIEDNVVGDARVGIFDDTSPLSPDKPGLISHNHVIWCEAALSFMPAVSGVTVVDNAFVENTSPIEIRGGGRLQGNEWARDGRGNFWSDYDGFEEGHSGTGATPYRAMALYEALVDAHPDLKLFEGGLASRAIDWGARVVPLVAPDPKIEDPNPLVAAPEMPQVPRARESAGSPRVAIVGVALLLVGLVSLALFGRHS